MLNFGASKLGVRGGAGPPGPPPPLDPLVPFYKLENGKAKKELLGCLQSPYVNGLEEIGSNSTVSNTSLSCSFSIAVNFQ